MQTIEQITPVIYDRDAGALESVPNRLERVSALARHTGEMPEDAMGKVALLITSAFSYKHCQHSY